MPVVDCKQCGKEFYVRPGRQAAGRGKYCSRLCASLARRKEITSFCAWCGKEFKARKEAQRFCGRSCAATHAHSTGLLKKQMKQKGHVLNQEGQQSFALFEDPWASGAIPPDRYAKDMYRMPDVGLGF